MTNTHRAVSVLENALGGHVPLCPLSQDQKKPCGLNHRAFRKVIVSLDLVDDCRADDFLCFDWFVATVGWALLDGLYRVVAFNNFTENGVLHI